MKPLNVNEIFTSFQGEGFYTGKYTTFVRFAGCNLQCSWCDTDYAQDATKGTPMTIDEIVAEVTSRGAHHVVFTGGEPLLQDHGSLNCLISVLGQAGYMCQIETNGTISYRKDVPVWITVSPKPNEYWMRLKADEVKVVVDEKVSPGLLEALETDMMARGAILVLQPESCLEDSYRWCVQLAENNPKWMIRLQQHKIMGVD